MISCKFKSSKKVILKLYIKNMVCIRCQMVVKAELEKLGLPYVYVRIGEADIIGDVQQEQLNG